MDVGTTIRNQISASDKWAFGSWGSKDMLAIDGGLQFKTSGMVSWKGAVRVTYDEAQDLYNVSFQRMRVNSKIEEIKGVYVEDLVRVIDQKVLG